MAYVADLRVQVSNRLKKNILWHFFPHLMLADMSPSLRPTGLLINQARTMPPRFSSYGDLFLMRYDWFFFKMLSPTKIGSNVVLRGASYLFRFCRDYDYFLGKATRTRGG